tara:strand:+ start:1991 stop:2872 length:882 start_codon:yes stop_codon:yes gene_type:complete
MKQNKLEKNMKILVCCTGFVGDHLFASALASEFPESYQVDYSCEMHQVMGLFSNDPYINNVYHVSEPNNTTYDKVFHIPPVDQSIPPPLYFRQMCGIDTNNTGYKVYTNKGIDTSARLLLPKNGKKNVAVMANWREKSFLFTQQQYDDGINHPPDLGYGGARRDVDRIIKELDSDINPIIVGFPDGTPNIKHQPMGGIISSGMYGMTASIIKACDYMIGAESGLINLAAGVGTKTIITGDFVHQLYGYNGVLKKIQEPKLGPEFYFPNTGHVSLDPYLTDDEVITQMREIICT